ncbi:Histidine kinase-, DNA gyrase B-, and HSP90-like ATPase [Mycolicibacterium flavescens]|uniref:ATP-binding protein n=1 Tax=Mycobacterium neumannii TaxID=2048551 RepID=UPI000F6E0E26|nr:ATP-binding protein [Mycobacterium neumannii]VEG45363.1 Histidine kinase-, DNA gyrase B-, and HSP90-like ATPase [Mycolicibacterium flavescens]
MTEAVKDFDIVPTSLAVKAMRDNGYKNAAYAIAELMDNSIQAGATTVQLLCADREAQVEQRARKRLHQVAVLDNGSGMDVGTLQIALQFGNGTRLNPEQQQGMGRFGMGLPSASISQCQRVDVWSWIGGPENALHSYIDLPEINAGRMRRLPAPQHKPLPKVWRTAAGKDAFRDTGTLVVWSNVDRVLWRTSKALIDNSEELIGRMYRYWINDGRVSIALKSFLFDEPDRILQERFAKPNDPLYLMANTSCPAPFDAKPMFRPFPEEGTNEVPLTVRFHGEDHLVTVKFSMATEEARDSSGGQATGSLPHGQHAARNLGVSVVRAGRELELDPAWATTYEPRERWWGVEISFEPGLDELFGVSNNKQSARNLAEAAKIDTTAIIKEHGGSIVAAREALKEEEDPIEPLLEIVHRVQTNIRQMRGLIQTQAEGRRRRVRHAEESIEAQATDAVRRRQKEGHHGRSDDDEKKPVDERKADVAEQLEHLGHSPESARELAAETIDKGLKYRVEVASLEGGAFFSVQPRGGVLLVTLNTDHPAYGLLLGARDPKDLPEDPDKLKEKLAAAQAGLEMMLFAWARYEDEQPNDQRRVTQNIRHDWGRMAEAFLGSRP